jgi:hypothetical protein
MLSLGVSFPLLNSVMPTSRRIWSIRPGCVNWMVLVVVSFEICTPRNANMLPSSFHWSHVESVRMMLSIVLACGGKKKQSST